MMNLETTIDKLFDLYVDMKADERTRLYGFMEGMVRDAAFTFRMHKLDHEVERMERHLATMHDYLINSK